MKNSVTCCAVCATLILTGCQGFDRGTPGDAVDQGTGREEGSTPYAVERTHPHQRAGMPDANIAISRAEASMDVSGPGSGELARRSAAATVVGTGRDLEPRSA